MLLLSTGARNQMLHTLPLRDIFNRGCAKINVYAGAAPATADAAVAGTLLCTITNGSATVKAKQKIRFTPTPGTANAGVWGITLNGTLVTFTDDGTPTAAEICTGLYNAWRVASGLIAVTTPACTINNPDVYQKFTFTDNGGTLDIEAATAGTAFDYSTSITGAGAGTGSWTTAQQTADAYGLRFEDAAAGIIEKLASQTWSGVAANAGTSVYFRLVLDSDDGTLSTTQPRIQGNCSTANSDLNLSSLTFVAGATWTIDTFPLTFPASRS